MQIGEFVQGKGGVSGHLRAVVNSGEPLSLTRHNRPYAAVVPQDWFERAAAALAREEAREGRVPAA